LIISFQNTSWRLELFSRKSPRLPAAEFKRYADEGFLLVSGLIPPDVVRRARETMSARTANLSAGSHHAFVQDTSILGCFSEDVCSVAAELAGSSRTFAAPATAYTISVMPQSGPWQWPDPHVDHALERDAHRTFPPPFAVGCLIYLTPISSHGGGTVVWPGSHRELEAVALSHPKDYEFLYALNRDISKVRLASPVEILAEAGDVLFYHYLCVHAGSANVGSAVRIALNHKW
jgi:hypothetical protein